MKDVLRNNLVRLSNANRDYVSNEISRLGSVDQRSTVYRRNGILNFGARQMTKFTNDAELYIIGVGGPPVAGP